MKLRYWFIGQAIIALLNGLGMIFMTNFYMSNFGFASLSDAATVMTRLLGAALIGYSVVSWMARQSTDTIARKAIVYGLTATNGVGFVIILLAQLAGIPNAMGWSIVALYLILALGFGYFILKPAD